MSPLFASVNPTTTLQTASLGYPYTHPLTVNVTFSEPVVGFGPAQVNITNGTVVSITGSGCQPNYVILIQPKIPGKITIFIPALSVTSMSTGAPNLVSNTLSIMGLNPAVRPALNFNLIPWTLTLPLPLGQNDNAIVIAETTLSGTPGVNNGYTNRPYFFTDPTTGAMNFFSPLNGGTTPNSVFARCELLEKLPGPSPTWTLKTFTTNTLAASLIVSAVTPSEKRIVIAQIHDKGNKDQFGNSASNSPLLKLYYDLNAFDPNDEPCNGCIYAQVRITPAQSSFLKIVNLIDNIPLNTLFMYQVKLLGNGALTIKANNTSTTIQLNTSNNNTIGWGAQSLYFKAGVYNLETGSSTTIGAAASFYSLQVTHETSNTCVNQ